MTRQSSWNPCWVVALFTVIFVNRVALVLGAPTRGPDLQTCKKDVLIPPHNIPVSCCPPLPKRPIRDFRFEEQTLEMRVRRPAHKVDAAYVEKYNRAYELMRALPNDDPRSFFQQANTHCAYCGFGHKQLGLNVTLEMHGTWLTFPFHRWYVYFHERILAGLLNDTSFALPFWNWDNSLPSQAGEWPSAIPSYFYTQPSLHDPLRDPKARPPAAADLTTLPTGQSLLTNSSLQELIDTNNNLLYSTIVSGATLPALFMGKPLRGGVEKTGLGASAFEVGPHMAIHSWVGDHMQPNGEDMTPLYSAARDPIFFAHHANCDRMWDVWKTLPGGSRTGFDDPDWLDSELLFYDENADMVRVRVRDSLDITKLRYSYEEVENPWANYLPVSLRKKGDATPMSTLKIASIAGWLSSLLNGDSSASNFFSMIKEKLSHSQDAECAVQSGNIVLSSSVYHTFVLRPKPQVVARPLIADSPVTEEILLLEGIRVPSGKRIRVDIFMMPDADEDTPLSSAAFIASYTNIPIRPDLEAQKSVKISFPVAIGFKIKSLGLDKHACVPISLVPRAVEGAEASEIDISDMRIEIEYL